MPWELQKFSRNLVRRHENFCAYLLRTVDFGHFHFARPTTREVAKNLTFLMTHLYDIP